MTLNLQEVIATAQRGRGMFGDSAAFEAWSARNCDKCVHDSIGAPMLSPEVLCPVLGAIIRGHWPAQIPVVQAPEDPCERPGECTLFEERS